MIFRTNLAVPGGFEQAAQLTRASTVHAGHQTAQGAKAWSMNKVGLGSQESSQPSDGQGNCFTEGVGCPYVEDISIANSGSMEPENLSIGSLTW